MRHSETISKRRSRDIFSLSSIRLAALARRRSGWERVGERRSVFVQNSPLLDPLTIRSSWGEEVVREF